MMLPASVDASVERVLDYDGLEARITQLADRYRAAQPWPHVVIDDFLPDDVALRAAAAFPGMDRARRGLARAFGARSYRGSLDAEQPVMRAVFECLHGPRFSAFVARVTGIAGLEADRHSVGAGYHQGARGSYLQLHADHNTHPDDVTRFRRVNVMLYLNDVWQRDWNGDLELWDREARAPRVQIAPVLNRCVILAVDDTTFHGYGPLRVPPGRTRNALAAYYYASAPAPGQSCEPHPTALPRRANEAPLGAFRNRVRRAVLVRLERILRLAQR